VALDWDVCVLAPIGVERLSARFRFEWSAPYGFPELRAYYRKPGRGPFAKARGWCNYLLALFRGLRKVRKKHGKPLLVHVHVLARIGLAALWLKWFRGIPFVVTEHWSRYCPEDTVSEFHNPLRKALTRLVIRQAAAVTTVSRSLQEAMQSHRLRNPSWYVVPNTVDVTLFRPAEGPGRQNEIPVMLHVSAMNDKPKNISGILRAFARWRQAGGRGRLEIVGDGPDREKLEALAGELKLGDAVRFPGRKNPAGVATSMQQADVFILNSRWENQPCVLLEAMACGLPVAAPRIAGIPEVVDNSLGRLFTPGDEEAMIRAWEEILNRKEEFDPEKMHRAISRQFSYEAICGKFSEIYRQILYD